MEVTIEEVAMLLGAKDIEIHQLQKRVAELQADRERLLDERSEKVSAES